MKRSKHDPLRWIDDELTALDRRHLRRALATHGGPQGAILSVGGQELINFGSNDYLGLAADARLAAAASLAAIDQGCGAGASPLITGHTGALAHLETRLAEFEGTEAALVFSSGYAANLGTIPALVERGDAIFADQKNHASMIDGCRLSHAAVHIYPHGDWRQLESLLSETAGSFRRRLIVTESVFSMDGDVAPLAELVELAERHHCILLVDEAHATGVLGPTGRGLCEALALEDRVHVRIGTLSKALGCAGGFVCGSSELIQWLVNRSRPYIFSTALAPPLAAAAVAALGIVRDEPWRRTQLAQRADDLRSALARQGWSVGGSQTQIIPLVVGEPATAVELSARLRELGMLAPAIRPPSVPAGESLLRISLSLAHDEAMIAQLVRALSALAPGSNVPAALASERGD